MDCFKWLYVLLLTFLTLCECDRAVLVPEPRHPDMLLFNAPNQYRKCGRRHDGRAIKCNDFGLSGGLV
uniref:Protein Wnt n=1 Tax=Glossina palpalis gambiensis TaxID=67801 RepID=A0A1B0BUQ9_9MUSC